mmetsp:Transcript_17370/g.43274  ORF Transcript_17370/g.43274 Transcript_17370/m.43274 type:complete len:248 (-) Transcript_17370:445-1188(-)
MRSEGGACASWRAVRRPRRYWKTSAAAAMLPSVSAAVLDLSAARTSSSSSPSAVGAPISVPIDRRAKSKCWITTSTSCTETESGPCAEEARERVRERARAAAALDGAYVESCGAVGSSVEVRDVNCSACSISVQAMTMTCSSEGMVRSISIAQRAIPPPAERCVGSQRGPHTPSSSASSSSVPLGERRSLNLTWANHGGVSGSDATGGTSAPHSRLSSLPPTRMRQGAVTVNAAGLLPRRESARVRR